MNLYAITSDAVVNELTDKIRFIYGSNIEHIASKKSLVMNYSDSLVFIEKMEGQDHKRLAKKVSKDGGRCVIINEEMEGFLCIKYPFELKEILSIGIEDKIKSPSNYVGRSKITQNLVTLLSLVSNSDSTALITGESGVGKEVASTAIHNMSTRKKMPFIAINCGAIPESLFESELFGYEKGSFTGAFGKKIGKIEEANGGTLFLDEVGELPMMMQTKLLRVLQERKVQRIGSINEVAVNIRIIAATNADLEDRVKRGEFREDLYYRLNVIPVHISPLRERTEDIMPLVDHFSENKVVGGLNISEDAKNELEQYSWPGNVREVGNIVERLHVFFQHKLINRKQILQVLSNKPIMPLYEEDGGDEISVSLSVKRTKINLKESVTEFEKRLIKKALDESNGVVKLASIRLGVKRTTMLEKMKRMNIE